MRFAFHFLSATFLAFSLGSGAAQAATTLNVYGPGGPAPAMKEAAKAFAAARNIEVNVTAGPTPQWVDKAKSDADLVYSGSENMMSAFANAMPGVFELPIRHGSAVLSQTM